MKEVQDFEYSRKVFDASLHGKKIPPRLVEQEFEEKEDDELTRIALERMKNLEHGRYE
jgi:hypothetical protein